MKPTDPAPRVRALLPAPAFAALAAAFLAVFVIAALSYRSLAGLTDAASAVNHTNEVQDHLNLLLSKAKDAETGQRGFLLTGVERYLDSYHLALNSLPTEVATLRHLLSGNTAQRRRLDTIEPMISSLFEDLAQTIAAKRNGDDDGALASLRNDRDQLAMARIRELIDAMLETEEDSFVQRTNAWETSVQWSSYIMFGGVGVVLAMIVLIGVLASRDFRSVAADGWARRVHLTLTSRLQDDLRLQSIGEKVLCVLVDHLHARVGAIYVTELSGELRRIAGHALAPGEAGAVVRTGDGLTGQAVKEARTVHVRDLPDGYLDISSTVGKTKPASSSSRRQAPTAPSRRSSSSGSCTTRRGRAWRAGSHDGVDRDRDPHRARSQPARGSGRGGPASG